MRVDLSVCLEVAQQGIEFVFEVIVHRLLPEVGLLEFDGAEQRRQYDQWRLLSSIKRGTPAFYGATA